MADKDAKERLRSLAEAAANFHPDSHIPIRRYFRSGNEMIKMAEVYFGEDHLEAAYVLYMKYITLHIEKLPRHKDFGSVLPQEKKKAKATVKEVMAKTEELKEVLRARFSSEHEVWLRAEKRRQEEEELRAMEERKRAEEEARCKAAEAASIERDRQVAMWHQAQLDAEARGLPPPPQPSFSPTTPPPAPAVYHPSSIEHSLALDAQRPPYNPSNYELPSAPSASPSAPSASPSAPSASPSAPPPSDPPPSYDRCVKPAPVASLPPPSVNPVPTFDRSAKPQMSNSSSMRTVILPQDLIPTFLRIAKMNSDRGIETLGTLGGSLRNNRLVISHLVIPRQTGKSDSCTMEGLEDVWDVHDRENIIFLGWIHTHPEYDVFLSSVDMHNQYEWQHMLPEALAIVCSIKFDKTGFLSLTEAGLQEIGRCDKVNFHPHSKEPPLFEEATHVEVDSGSRVTLKDLR